MVAFSARGWKVARQREGVANGSLQVKDLAADMRDFVRKKWR